MDIVVSTNDGGPLLLRNNGNKNNWILINTVGSLSNRDGIGARIHIVGESGLEAEDLRRHWAACNGTRPR